MTGKIIKGISGFYYVYVAESGIYECRAKGVFRKRQLKPLVGDEVEIEVIDEGQRTGNVVEILPRKNSLIRPAVANIDQAMVIFATASPEPNLHLLNRFLVSMAYHEIPALICFNKVDLIDDSRQGQLADVLKKTGYPCLFISASEEQGIERVRQFLAHKTTAVAGPSGVGKSSLINCLQKTVVMETGQISEKIGRGRHTTRHSEIIPLESDAYILDTPGFTSFELPRMEKEELQDCFPEFREYRTGCKFLGCMHDREPGCRVREAYEAGELSRERYEDYRVMLGEIREQKRY